MFKRGISPKKSANIGRLQQSLVIQGLSYCYDTVWQHYKYDIKDPHINECIKRILHTIEDKSIVIYPQNIMLLVTEKVQSQYIASIPIASIVPEKGAIGYETVDIDRSIAWQDFEGRDVFFDGKFFSLPMFNEIKTPADLKTKREYDYHKYFLGEMKIKMDPDFLLNLNITQC